MKTQTPGQILSAGEIFMEDAIKSEEKGEYILAEAMYELLGEMMENLLYRFTKEDRKNKEILKEKTKAQSLYLRALTGRAYLPTTDQKSRGQVLKRALRLAQDYYSETASIEYKIAMDCIQKELDQNLQGTGGFSVREDKR